MIKVSCTSPWPAFRPTRRPEDHRAFGSAPSAVANPLTSTWQRSAERSTNTPTDPDPDSSAVTGIRSSPRHSARCSQLSQNPDHPHASPSAEGEHPRRTLGGHRPPRVHPPDTHPRPTTPRCAGRCCVVLPRPSGVDLPCERVVSTLWSSAVRVAQSSLLGPHWTEHCRGTARQLLAPPILRTATRGVSQPRAECP